MSEFGNQIDVEYEVWAERGGTFNQACLEAPYGYLSVNLETATRLATEYNNLTSDHIRYFPVEVVSVRSEYGTND